MPHCLLHGRYWVNQLKLHNDIPCELISGPAHLRFEKAVPVIPGGELVTYYHFKILNEENLVVGHINFRVGDTNHVKMCAGHVGYGIIENHRGNHYSYHACKALGPFIRQHYEQVILTADPSNQPSLRTLEKLGARFIDVMEVPQDDPAYKDGASRKRRYEWRP